MSPAPELSAASAIGDAGGAARFARNSQAPPTMFPVKPELTN